MFKVYLAAPGGFPMPYHKVLRASFDQAELRAYLDDHPEQDVYWLGDAEEKPEPTINDMTAVAAMVINNLTPIPREF